MIESTRIRTLNQRRIQKRSFVLYWMQASQRAEFNHALEYAVLNANELGRPLLVFFNLFDSFPEANERHYAFMLEGLRETERALNARGIKLIVWRGRPELNIPKIARNASLVITDRGYTRIQRRWRETVAKKIDVPLIQVESDVVVPVEAASAKQEYAAATIRPKITKLLPAYLKPFREIPLKKNSSRIKLKTINLQNIGRLLKTLKIDHSVRRSPYFSGGLPEARKHLKAFIRSNLARYDEARNDPNENGTSNLSPYLHFGQISPLEIALALSNQKGPSVEAYLEELIVRRELSMNYVFYNTNYDSFAGLPAWPQKTLAKHLKDRREYVYSLADFERAKTRDPYWNAAQKEMVVTGKMHGYMRMYWGKKILEWSKTPEEAFQTAIYLNNKYELDGRDPNGFAGVAWCFGSHDRPWGERAIFGNVRYMNAAGLNRKFDADAYAKKIEAAESFPGF